MSPNTLRSITKILKIALFCLSIIGIWYLYKDYLLRRKARQQLPTLSDQLTSALTQIDDFFSYEEYFSNYSKKIFLKENKVLRSLIPAKVEKLGLPGDLLNFINRFTTAYDELEQNRKTYNDEFIIRESEKYADFFDSLESYSLSAEQVEGIIRNEDNNLIIAGAGTGKTTTIAGKVAYILKKGLAKPDELLIISFTKNAVQEMYDRCMRFCKHIPDAMSLEVRTFNSFGYFVTRSCSVQELHLAFKGNEQQAKGFLQESFDRLFIEDASFQRKAINFLSFFNRPERDEFEFESRNKFIKHEQSFKNITLDGKEVKSKEELQIANFFCLQGIQYEYEKHYPLQEEDRRPGHAAYYPDFYLPEYKIWLEHYAMDRDGNVPHWFTVKPGYATAKDYYQALAKWKENIHVKYGTKLIKTYSYESKEGCLLSNLKKTLTEMQVVFTPPNPKDLLKMVHESPHYEDFINLIHTFLGLMKSNGKTPETVKPQQSDKRFKVFMSVFTPLYNNYEQHLQKHSQVDFNDMINQAATHLAHGDFTKAYKYILIDEFQDMSIGRYELLKSIRIQNPSVKLYAVGDDWQSIFRFTGSDMSIITQFEHHFGVTSQTNILKTYRFNDQILEVSSNFIQKNPAQLRKTLSAGHVANAASFVFIASDKITGVNTPKSTKSMQIEIILREILAKQSDALVYLIGRYHHNQPQDLTALRSQFRGLTIEYHTAHKVKGMTCDYAILLDLNSGTLGFPSEMADDPILNGLLHEGERFDNAEERRVFYVAITRAKHRNYLLYNAINPSKFVLELNENLGLESTTTIRCPECDGIMIKRKGPFSEFYGCTNYPECNGKMSLASDNAAHSLKQ